MVRRSYRPPEMWKFPRPHDFRFYFGLGLESPNQCATIVPYVMHDNALVDYETIKTNPENADFAVYAGPNCCAGSIVPKVTVKWEAFTPKLAAADVTDFVFYHMDIHTSMLNRLTAEDKKSGSNIEELLFLTHETTDEQTYPLWSGTDLFQGHHAELMPTNVPGLTTNQTPESVGFVDTEREEFFDAMQYYTNREMLRKCTGPMIREVVHSRTATKMGNVVYSYTNNKTPSMCKFMNPYTFCGELFHLPQVTEASQWAIAADTTNIEHLSIIGHVRYNEFNSDFNFSRA